MTTTPQDILQRLRNVEAAQQQKTAAAAATDAPALPSAEAARLDLEQALAAAQAAGAQAEKQAQSEPFADTAVLRMLVDDLQAAEMLALTKEGAVIGAAVMEGIVASSRALPAPTKIASTGRPYSELATPAQRHAERLKVAYDQGLADAQALLQTYHQTQEDIMAQNTKIAEATNYLDEQGRAQLQWANQRIHVAGQKTASAQGDLEMGAEMLDTAFQCGAHSARAMVSAFRHARS